MNNEQISRKVAALFNVNPKGYIAVTLDGSPRRKEQEIVVKPMNVWLIEDAARMLDLALENNVNYVIRPEGGAIFPVNGDGGHLSPVFYKDHGDNKRRAALWALGLALIDSKEVK